MSYYQHLKEHQADLFESLCWIYYPMLPILWEHHRGEAKITVDGFVAKRKYGDYWTIKNKDIPDIKCHAEILPLRVYPTAEDEVNVEFSIKLPLLRTIKLAGVMYRSAHLLSTFKISNSYFGLDYKKTEIRNVIELWNKKANDECDKQFFEWVGEIQHLSTLAKVSL